MIFSIIICLISLIYFLVTYLFTGVCEPLEFNDSSFELLSFSFNKHDFNDFKCNFSDEILSDNLLKIPPFYYSKPVRNFFNIFSLFFQYSEIMNDSHFKETMEGMFKCHLWKLHQLENISSDFIYNPLSFENHLDELMATIINIMNKDNAIDKIVKVVESDGRIIISPNYLVDLDFNIKLIEEISSSTVDDSISDEIVAKFDKFYTNFNEMYLQNLLKGGFAENLLDVFKEYKKRINVDVPTSENLISLYSQFYELIEIEEKQLSNNIEDEFHFIFQKNSKLFLRLCFDERISNYLYELISKASVKILYDNISSLDYTDIDFIYSKEYRAYPIAAKELLTKALKDSKKISYENIKLSDKSFENLVKFCLEITI